MDAHDHGRNLANLYKLSRAVSASRLATYTSEEPQIEELGESLPVYASRMALILLNGGSIRITFKVHYDVQSVSRVVAKAYSSSPDCVNDIKAVEFFKEFCNLIAGGIKVGLASTNVDVGISIPLAARGFDEVFFPPLTGLAFGTDVWRLRTNHIVVTCSMSAEIFDELKIETVEHSETESGKVDFL